jgi:hypothetical protein
VRSPGIIFPSDLPSRIAFRWWRLGRADPKTLSARRRSIQVSTNPRAQPQERHTIACKRGPRPISAGTSSCTASNRSAISSMSRSARRRTGRDRRAFQHSTVDLLNPCPRDDGIGLPQAAQLRRAVSHSRYQARESVIPPACSRGRAPRCAGDGGRSVQSSCGALAHNDHRRGRAGLSGGLAMTTKPVGSKCWTRRSPVIAAMYPTSDFDLWVEADTIEVMDGHY